MKLYLKESSITPPASLDWNGDKIPAEFHFILEVDKESITYGGRFPKSCFALGVEKQFMEGLWAGTVVELFIHDKNGPGYIELNLSPTGAYWIAEFSDYRVRSGERKLPTTIEIYMTEESVDVALKIERAAIPFAEFSLAQTAILDLGSIKPHDRIFVARKYAWSEAAKGALNSEADFHKKKLAEVF